MDFYRIGIKETKEGVLEIYPDFLVGRSEDLMVRARGFYAIWDEKTALWSTDEYDVQRLVDEELWAYADQKKAEGVPCNVKSMRSFDSNSWNRFRSFVGQVSDNSTQLDQSLTFASQKAERKHHVSKRLSYDIEPGDCSAWDEMIGTLYSVEERTKIEWAIGSVLTGDSKSIEKFLVFYGSAGTGKSTVLKIIEKLFRGYVSSFEAKALGSNSNQFATEAFKSNPLVAIQHDGDLSRIEDNTVLNSIISHEPMRINEKYKPGYDAQINAFLFMGTNQPVKITDSKSGIIRRLIDVHPTGVRIPANHYTTLVSRIDFELGAIAHHCREVYLSLGKNHYNGYKPLEMMFQTDVFFNFVESTYDIFKAQDGTTLKQAYQLYKEFCADSGIERPLPMYKMRSELQNYFDEFKDRAEVDGHMVRNYYSGFNARPFKAPAEEANTYSLVLDETESLLDEMLGSMPAQGATTAGTPLQRWASVATTLADIDTSQQHFVKVPANHIVIDFDLKGEDGEKSLERNLEAASVWPVTYAEISKGGAGIHLHYLWTGGDVAELSPTYSDGIEIKVYTGDSSLRRRLSKCNALPVSELSTGLPKKEKKMQNPQTMQSERGLRNLIERNLRKEIHPGTKPSVDFIKTILDEAYSTGMVYDVTDMRSRIMTFATNSSNKAMECLKLVQIMKFHSERAEVPAQAEPPTDAPIVFFDVEVYPNLFVVCWKYQGVDEVARMINPSAQEIEKLLSLKLVGFNCRHYDNHIIYAAYLGYSVEQLYQLSQKIIVQKDRNASFGEAYSISYSDIFEFSSKKESLKWFEIHLGLTHMEMDLPWDQPVPDELIPKVVEYCVNDVRATEAVFEDRKGDFTARQILAELSGLTINDTTPKHTARIIFGNVKNPQQHFTYTNLGNEFPGYKYSFGKSEYAGEDPGEGGYVYAEPGIYENVALLDVASMHPTSLVQLGYFGEYTENFHDLLKARLAIKAGDYDSAREMLDGRLAPYLTDKEGAKELAYALKIVINIVYGLTSAKFDNPFRDPRNKDNIVAKRGALFMIDLKHAVQAEGYTVVHIKTDSIKIANADEFIIDFVSKFGEKYGYDFEHEATYERFCLVNDAVYIAREANCLGDCWKAVGAQFQHPFVYKTLFTGEEVTFNDMCETKQVQKGSMHLAYEDGKRIFVGKSGRFVPVTSGGGTLLRVNEDKDHAVSGTKGFLWMDAEMAKKQDDLEIDVRYFDALAEKAVAAINKYGDYEEFIR